MGWIVGGWRILNEGEVHQALKKCIDLLLDQKFILQADLITEKKDLVYGKDPYELLRDFEKRHGVSELLEVLTKGLKLECKERHDKIIVEILLRTPSDSEESKQTFKDMISAWIKENPLTFSERFFRLPKIGEDIADRYFDNSLEQSLTRFPHTPLF